MANLNINGQNYTLKAEGKLDVKKIKDAKEVEKDFHDDIVVQGKQGLVSLRADELDIEGSWTRPYVGLPDKGDAIRLEQPGKPVVEGTVVVSEDENDAVTHVQRAATLENMQKQYEKAKEGMQEMSAAIKESLTPSQETQKQLQQAGEAVQAKVEEMKQAVAPEPTLAEKIEKKIENVAVRLDPDPPPAVKIKNAINEGTDKLAGGVRDGIRELTGQTLTVGKTETFEKGDVSFGVSISNSPAVTGSYTIAVQNLDERMRPTGGTLVESPHTQTVFAAHAVETRLGPQEISVGYKGNLGLEFNRPMENDFSISVVGLADVGTRPGGSAFMSFGTGLEGRYQLNDKWTLYGGPVYRGTVVGDPGPGAGLGLELGAKVKF